jgi:hypothetical protein
MREDRPVSTPGAGTGAPTKRNLVLAAMVFAVAMTFIDQTIVAIAIPKIQQELSLTPTGAQSLGAQSFYIALAGAGLGLMLGPASTDAVNRAPSTSYSEVTGITQTARNFGASLGLAVLGAILITRNDTNVTAALTKHGVPSGVAHRIAASFGGSGPPAGSANGRSPALIHDVQLAFAHSTQTVFYIMAGVMAATFLFAVRWLPRGRLEHVDEGAAQPPPTVPESLYP